MACRAHAEGDVRSVTAGARGAVVVHLPPLPRPADGKRGPCLKLQVHHMPPRSVHAHAPDKAVVAEAETRIFLPSKQESIFFGPLERAGPHLMALTINGAHVVGSPFLLQCMPGAWSAEASGFEIERSRAGAGDESHIVLIARDAFGNACGHGGAIVTAELQPDDARAAEGARDDGVRGGGARGAYECSVDDRGDGTYAVRVRSDRAGSWRVVARMDGAYVGGAHLLEVEPGAPHGPCCAVRAERGGHLEGIAGERHALELVVRDAYGNLCSTCGEWTAEMSRESFWGRDEVCDAPLVHESDAPGVATILCFARRAGPHALTLRRAATGAYPGGFGADGGEDARLWELESVRTRVLFGPGPADADGFVASGDGLAFAVAGEPARVVITPAPYGSRAAAAAAAFATLSATLCLASGDAVPVRCFRAKGPPDGEAVPEVRVAREEVVELGPQAAGEEGAAAGPERSVPLVFEQWLLSYTCSRAGEASLHVTLGDKPICMGGRPFSVLVAPGRAHAPSTLWSAASGVADDSGAEAAGGGHDEIEAACACERELVAGDTWALKLSLRDRYGNVRRVGGDRVSLLVCAAPDRLPDASCAEGEQVWRAADIDDEAGAADGADFDEGGGGVAGVSNGAVLPNGRSHPSCAIGLTDREDGTYRAAVRITRSGYYAWRCWVGGAPVGPAGSLHVRAAAVCAANCGIGGEAVAASLRNNRWATVCASLRDAFGNACTAAGDCVHVATIEGLADVEQPQCVGRGEYTGRVRPRACGALALSVSARGAPIAGSPLRPQIESGPTLARKSFAEGDGWSARVASGKRLAFTVHALDSAGSAASGPSAEDDRFAVHITPRAHGHRHARTLRAVPVGGGRHLVEYELVWPGSYVLSATLKGAHIRGSPLDMVATEQHDASIGGPSRAERAPNLTAKKALIRPISAPVRNGKTPGAPARGLQPRGDGGANRASAPPHGPRNLTRVGMYASSTPYSPS